MRLSFQIKDWISPGKVFIILSAGIFILLPLLSTDAGISGDEPVHYQQAEYVYNYFRTGGGDSSALNTPQTHLKYYGQLVDNISYYLNQALNSKNPYLVRHLLNSFLGALLILFAGLLAVKLSGYRAGIITIVFLFLSPRILGHSYNNLKDIPFAAGYIIGIYGLAGVITSFPEKKLWPWVWMCLGFALAFGTRAGGLVLIPVYLFFILIRWITQSLPVDYKNPAFWKKGLILFSFTFLACLAGFLLAIALWPYARQAPIRNSLESLDVMTHFSVSIRQLFEGEWLWSEFLPAYYPVKYILITSPLLIIAGFLAQFISWNKKKAPLLSLLNFAALFPLLWIILKGSNLYGAWRHVLFVFPPLVVISAASWEMAARQKGSLVRIIVSLALLAGLAGPFIHIIRYHPVEYVYFNRLTNGVKGAFYKYETDYYYHSMGPATRWLRAYLIDNEPGKTFRVASNFPLEPYFDKDETIIPVYTHYLSRSKSDWDYGIFTNTFLGPDFLKSENWPPGKSLYTFTIEGKVICSIIKRPSKSDLRGIEFYRDSRFQESIASLRKAIELEPGNVFARLYLAWAYRQTGEIESSDSLVTGILEQQPLNDMARDLLGRNQIIKGDYKAALDTYSALKNNNYKYLPLYEQSAIAADSLGDYKKAAGLMQRGVQLGLRDPSSLAKLREYRKLAEMRVEDAKIQNNSK